MNKHKIEMKEITVKDLYFALAKEMTNGNATKKILVADDDEGNGYHPIYFAVTPMENFEREDLDCCFLHGVDVDDALENYIVIG